MSTWSRPDTWPEWHVIDGSRPGFPYVQARCGMVVDYTAAEVEEAMDEEVPLDDRCAACSRATRRALN